MEDIVAVAVELDTGEKRYFLTWGRIQDAVDPRALEALVLSCCKGYSLGGTPVGAQVCWSLQEAARETYFYEGLWHFSQQKIPFGLDYDAWRQKMALEMPQSRHLYYLGKPRTPGDEGSWDDVDSEVVEASEDQSVEE